MCILLQLLLCWMGKYLQKALRHDPFRDLWKTLFEVLQDVVVELRASLRHPESTQRVNEPTAAAAGVLSYLVSSPDDAKITEQNLT